MKKAYTLIELVLVISIVLILVSISTMSFKNSENFKAKNDLYKIKRNLEVTRSLAISQRDNATLSLKDSSYSIVCKDIKEEKQYSKNLILTNYGNKRTVTFTKRGSPTFDGSGTIVFKIKNKLYYITIEPVTGKVNLKDEERIFSN